MKRWYYNGLLWLASAFLLGIAGCDERKGHEDPESASSTTVVTAGQPVRVLVGTHGYTPESIETAAGKPLTLVFKRTTDESCGQEVVFPDYNIRRALPLNEEVTVELQPKKNETVAFTCGMGMYRGRIIAR